VRLICGLVLLASGAAAQEYVTTAGPLSEIEFYRLVACAAPPGGVCGKPVVRWTLDLPLRVAITRMDRAFPGGKAKRAEAALARGCGGAQTRVWFGANGTIRRAAVLFSRTLSIRTCESAMLEEVMQALGLLTDSRNPFFDTRPVLSQDSNAMKMPGPQDIMALHRHDPPE
jgi:hypothetical protein